MGSSDTVLLRRLGSDPGGEAMRTLYRMYGGELYGFACHQLGDRGQAEDLVQEVFTRVWRHAGDFDPERASFRTWLYRITRNAIVDQRRRAAVRPGPPPAEAPDEPAIEDREIETALLRWQVSAALGRLTPDHRQVIQLAYFESLTLREVAERTGLPLGTVKSRAFFALRNLRLAFDEMEAGP